MNRLIQTTLTMLFGALMASNIQAHNPRFHEQNAEKPKCEAMNNSDLSAKDKQDPVAQALMEQCAQSQSATDGSSDQHAPTDSNSSQPNSSQSSNENEHSSDKHH